jgi:hypothetical protein
MLNCVEKILNHLPESDTNKRILQIGPGKVAYEFEKKVKNSYSNECHLCPYSLICKNFDLLGKDAFACPEDQFNDIILMANSEKYSIENIQQLLPMMNKEGRLILFAHDRSDSKHTDLISFPMIEVLSCINRNQFRIQSVTNIKNGENPIFGLILSHHNAKHLA